MSNDQHIVRGATVPGTNDGSFAPHHKREADTDLLQPQREPYMVTVRLQLWGHRDQLIEVEQVQFDAAEILVAVPPQARARVEEDGSDHDWLLFEAQKRGLVKDWDGPFDVDVMASEMQEWFDRNPHVPEDPAVARQRTAHVVRQRVETALGTLGDDERRLVFEQLYADETFRADIQAAQRAAGEYGHIFTVAASEATMEHLIDESDDSRFEGLQLSEEERASLAREASFRMQDTLATDEYYTDMQDQLAGHFLSILKEQRSPKPRKR